MNIDYKAKLLQEVFRSQMTWRAWYRTIYLKSDHWKALRKLALHTHGKKCHKCSKAVRLDVHHLNYRNIFDVEVTDLQILCRPCHKAEHQKPAKMTAKTARVVRKGLNKTFHKSMSDPVWAAKVGKKRAAKKLEIKARKERKRLKRESRKKRK